MKRVPIWGGGKKPKSAQTRPAVPVPINVVPVPNGHCLFLSRWYRYHCPIFFSFIIFFILEHQCQLMSLKVISF